MGFELAISETFDLIILDWMLPDTSGVVVCQHLRQRGASTPVLMLTARDAVEDKVTGLDAGADDYLVKPFAFEELLARIRVLLRRQTQLRTNLLRVADLEMDMVSREVRRGNRHIDLTPREYALLCYMMRRSGRVLSRTILTEQVWDHDFASGTNVVDVYINYLRKKIDQDSNRPLIHTVRGIGYVLRDGGVL
jgi:DNA-binding response OmpR family regulator